MHVALKRTYAKCLDHFSGKKTLSRRVDVNMVVLVTLREAKDLPEHNQRTSPPAIGIPKPSRCSPRSHVTYILQNDGNGKQMVLNLEGRGTF